MKTNLADFIRDTPEGKEANAILRACVHCGFCTATCPTYQLLGDELDGPRGRIYLMKELFEGGRVSQKTQLHLDRCLTCRSCETTCPSGVRYGRLVDIGRNVVEKEVGRSFASRLVRSALKTVLTNPVLFKPLLRLGQLTRPLLPGPLANKVPPRVARDTVAGRAPRAPHAGVGGLRAAGHRAYHQSGDGARARPHRHFLDRGPCGGLLRGGRLSSQRAGRRRSI